MSSNLPRSHSTYMYASIGVMHMINELFLDRVHFDTLNFKYREVCLNPSIWHLEVQNRPLKPLRVNKSQLQNIVSSEHPSHQERTVQEPFLPHMEMHTLGSYYLCSYEVWMVRLVDMISSSLDPVHLYHRHCQNLDWQQTTIDLCTKPLKEGPN